MQTIEEVKRNPDFMTGLEIPEFSFNAYLIFQGTDIFQYVTFWEGEKLFYGDDFKPEIVKDPLTTICQLLALLTVQPGVEPWKTFEDYNPRQMQWAVCPKCSELKTKVDDFLNDTSEGHNEAKIFFEMRFAT